VLTSLAALMLAGRPRLKTWPPLLLHKSKKQMNLNLYIRLRSVPSEGIQCTSSVSDDIVTARPTGILCCSEAALASGVAYKHKVMQGFYPWAA
jgi:hypothetical protein